MSRPPRGGRGLKWVNAERVISPPLESPSSRRAWIEICTRICQNLERVGRPPRGGRGLKFADLVLVVASVFVALLAEGVD